LHKLQIKHASAHKIIRRFHYLEVSTEILSAQFVLTEAIENMSLLVASGQILDQQNLITRHNFQVIEPQNTAPNAARSKRGTLQQLVLSLYVYSAANNTTPPIGIRS
jgi:hypothetical protein